jgi:hypothetical protein
LPVLAEAERLPSAAAPRCPRSSQPPEKLVVDQNARRRFVELDRFGLLL